MLAERLNLDESLKNEWPGKIQFTPTPEVATLRDQFAMAAMIADSIQSAVVSAAYIGQGKVLHEDYPGPETGAKDYYATADAILEARK
ncbi:MAG: hypothetical protein KGI06_06265 [Candidatus Micrarchaeota archaeon]|nr:hypothetical protein [Candidatus Micrarchaeota archaeon]